jgi:membrane-bound lytic murein transglycosylase B
MAEDLAMILTHLRRARSGGSLLRAASGAATLLGLLLVLAAPARANDRDFASWLQGLRGEALSRGISAATFSKALAHVAPIPRVIELDRKQPEVTLTFEEYIARVVPQARIEKGRQLLAENRQLLERVTATYGVQPRYIVALWGIESDFGRITGDFPVVAALATLAYDGRRSGYFRGELLNALQILQLGYIDLGVMRGSWAGAMGQTQFMPSNYLHYAVDFEGKGRRDIWHDRADVFASAANFLLHLGWKADEDWGCEVTLPPGFDASQADLGIRKPIGEWRALGLRRPVGAALPAAPKDASVVRPGGDGGPAYLVYDNYRAIMKWNRSLYFATAVGLLADGVGGR